MKSTIYTQYSFTLLLILGHGKIGAVAAFNVQSAPCSPSPFFFDAHTTTFRRSSALFSLHDNHECGTERSQIESSRRAVLKRVAAAAAVAASGFQTRPTPAVAVALTAAELAPAPLPVPSQRRAICDPTVLTLKKGNRILHIIGTAHISSVSADLSKQLVQEVAPDAVFIELDLKRISRAFRSGRPAPGLTIGYQDESGKLKVGTVAEAPTGFGSAIIGKIINKGAELLGNPIQSMYKKLESDGFTPGAEFINAVEAGLEQGSVIVLGDRDMDITLRRIAQALASTDPKKLAAADQKLTAIMKAQMPEMEKSSGGALGPDELKEFIERIKTKDTTKLLMDVFRDEVPQIHYALVGERDVYMARNVDKLSQFQSMVAVMGLGHLEGVSNNLEGLGWTKVPKIC